MNDAVRWIGAAVLAAVTATLAAAAAAADPGISSTTIVIGQSAAFSGPASELGNEMRAGALAYFQQVNAAGGVNGRKIELRSLDDGYESDRAAANTRKLIDDGVFLLFGYVGTPTSNASKPIFTAARVPFVGPFTGAESLRNPLNRYLQRSHELLRRDREDRRTTRRADAARSRYSGTTTTAERGSPGSSAR